MKRISVDVSSVNQLRLRGMPTSFVTACGNGEFIFVGTQTGMSGTKGKGDVMGTSMADQTRVALEHIRQALEPFDAGLDDIVKLNSYYVGADGASEALAARGEFFAEGPVSTGVGVSRIMEEGVVFGIEAVAVPGQHKVFSRGIHDYGYLPPTLPFRVIGEAGGLAWIAGVSATHESGYTLAPGDAAEQLALTLEVLRRRLAAVGAVPDDVVQLRCYWSEECRNIGELIESRNAFFARSPAFVDLVIPGFPADGLMLEMDVTAIDHRAGYSPGASGMGTARIRASRGLAYSALHLGGNDPSAGIQRALQNALSALDESLASVGSGLEDVLLMHVYYADHCAWRDVLQALGESVSTEAAVSVLGMSGIGATDAIVGLDAIAIANSRSR